MADPFTSVLIGFADELRSAGLTVGSGDVLSYFAAMTPLDPTDLVDLYWAGRATLVSRHEDDPVYHQVFRRYFLDEEGPGNVSAFLAEHRGWSAEEIVLPAGRRHGLGLRLTPVVDGTDGFFVASLRRTR